MINYFEIIMFKKITEILKDVLMTILSKNNFNNINQKTHISLIVYYWIFENVIT